MDLAAIDYGTALGALQGGALIGLSTALLLLLNGKIAGISGIVGALLGPTRGDTAWRLFFLAGLVGGGAAMWFLSPGSFQLENLPSGSTAAAAGLLVGFGTRLGNGCTSGHGVCGISRFSQRSIVATLTFITAGAIMVFVTRHLLGGAL